MSGAVLVIGCIASYFFGTLPSAIIVARSKNIDITTFGSGNPGASNVARALGWKYGTIVLILDGLKGALPSLAGVLADSSPAAYIFGASAIVGHIFPITRKFKGGKGIATGAGMLIPLHLFIILGAAALWVVIMKTTKKASIASIVAVPAILIALIASGIERWELLSFIAVGALVEIRHTANIKRLLTGQEPPVSGVAK